MIVRRVLTVVGVLLIVSVIPPTGIGPRFTRSSKILTPLCPNGLLTKVAVWIAPHDQVARSAPWRSTAAT